MRRSMLLAFVTLAVAPAGADPTVTISLSSPRNGAVVSAGASIPWTISVAVSGGDNAGLALVSCDFQQSLTNPAFFDIPVAAGVPTGMTNFARPAGVSNPGTGYRGTQIGPVGQRNLVQIGGGQNTFGIAMSPGAGVAENATAVGGVGQSGAQIVATGTFNAPSACGTYAYSIANGLASVMTQLNTPPAISPVLRVTPSLATPSIAFLVTLPGDVDGDRDVDLSDLSVLLANFGVPSGATRATGDLDGDADVDLSDLSILLAYFGAAC